MGGKRRVRFDCVRTSRVVGQLVETSDASPDKRTELGANRPDWPRARACRTGPGREPVDASSCQTGRMNLLATVLGVLMAGLAAWVWAVTRRLQADEIFEGITPTRTPSASSPGTCRTRSCWVLPTIGRGCSAIWWRAPAGPASNWAGWASAVGASTTRPSTWRCSPAWLLGEGGWPSPRQTLSDATDRPSQAAVLGY